MIGSPLPCNFSSELTTVDSRAMFAALKQSFFVSVVCLLCLTGEAWGQLGNPIPTPIVKQGLRVQIDDVVQFPDSEASLGGKPDHIPSSRARINFFRESPDGRYFVNDLRGQLYRLDENLQPQLYLDIDTDNGGSGSIFPATWFASGLAAGFISYNFHPEFETNGSFYTIHMERAADTSAVPDFFTVDERSGSHPVNWHTVITEWTAADPLAPTWNEGTGTRREVLRVGTTADSYFHPYGDLQFNPNSHPGDDDYGLLYISGGDWGYINGAGAPQGSGTEGQPGQLQRLDTLAGTLIRIDPRSPSETGGQAGIGDYTIPADNPFVDGDSNTLDEIYAFGFRNGHRMAWDTDNTLFVNNVGHASLEEVERVIAAGNYGWTNREGTFVNGNDLANGGNGDADVVFANNVPDNLDVDFRGEEYLYPVAQYDHSEGNANAGGFVYHGTMIPQLYGKYIFGDIVNGRLFATDVSAMKNVDISEPGPTAPIEEIQLFTKDQFGVETDVDLRGDYLPGRVDLRFGLGSDGEIWIITKEDGYLRRLVGAGPGIVLFVDPTTGQAVLKNTSATSMTISGYSILSESESLLQGNWDSLADHSLSGWDEAPPEDSALSELNPYGELVLNAGDRYNLGRIYDAMEGAEDLELEFLMTGAGDFSLGTVLYRLAADFNLDQVVDLDDLQQWQASYGVDAEADADGDGDTDGDDFLVWQRQVGMSTAPLAASQAVPEPTTLLIVIAGFLCLPHLQRVTR